MFVIMRLTQHMFIFGYKIRKMVHVLLCLREHEHVGNTLRNTYDVSLVANLSHVFGVFFLVDQTEDLVLAFFGEKSCEQGFSSNG